MTKYDDSKLGFALDKDLWEIGNKIYCPEHCFLIPQELNNMSIYSTVTNPKTGIELSRNGKRFMPHCSDGCNVRVRLPIVDSFEDAVNSYREFKHTVITTLLHRHEHNIEVRLFDKLINFKYEVYIGDR